MKVIYADTIVDVYWEILGGCRRILENFEFLKTPGHYWTWSEIQDECPDLCLHPYPPYIDSDNKVGLALQYGNDMAWRGVDVGLPSLFKRKDNGKKFIWVDKDW